MGSTSSPLYKKTKTKPGLQIAIQHLSFLSPPPPPPPPPTHPSPFCVPKSRLWTTHRHNPMQCTVQLPPCWLGSCCSNHRMCTYFHGCPIAHFNQLIQRESVTEFGSTAHKHYMQHHRCEDQHWVNSQIQKWGTDLHRHTTTAPQTQKTHLLLCSCFEQIHREVIILTSCK